VRRGGEWEKRGVGEEEKNKQFHPFLSFLGVLGALAVRSL
jgi:hypothetical protein